MRVLGDSEIFKITKLTEDQELAKSIEGINIEMRLLDSLLKINKLIRRGKISEQEALTQDVDFVGTEILRLQTSAWDTNMHSGTNGEVLSRLVGKGILEDFPTISTIEKMDQPHDYESKVGYQYKFVDGKVKLGISVVTKTDIDESETPIRMDCVMNLSKKYLQLRRNETEKEITRLEKNREELRV